MKIAYSWLKDYIKTDLTPDGIADILTQTGLEVAAIEAVESIKGGLKGVVVGEVVSCKSHPDSDHLNITQVNVGSEELLPIVCGAPNVAQGQKVMVATVGAVLYDGDKEFLIKKAKLRGQISMGMICSEVELGVGADQSGILVLEENAEVGTSAAKYFNLDDDYSIEIDITPNRIDGASHIGAARDLAAFLATHGATASYTRPSVEDFFPKPQGTPVKITVEASQSCPRYAGVCLSNIKVASSPEWLQKRLKTIGLSPINNIVDITNYVLFETGQPLHAFDRARVQNDIVVKTMPQGTKFTTLDNVERTLDSEDLMICSATEPMCIAGVFGGLDSGVTDATTEIFLESAYFNPVQVRKTARRHGLNTDASFRFERGADPEMTLYALKRAALLMQEYAGATISSEITDVYPEKIEGAKVQLSLKQVERLTGIVIDKPMILTILEKLEIVVKEDNGDVLSLNVPAYRVDVTREADVIEEILRIYGYNNIPVKSEVKSVLSYAHKPDTYQLKNKIGDYLTANGFNEIMNNSLTKVAYYEGLEMFSAEENVLLKNPLSQDLGMLRRTLLFGGLESIAYNCNRKHSDLRLYEFGKTYHYQKNEANAASPVKDYSEYDKLAIFLTGNKEAKSWNSAAVPTDFFCLKAFVMNVLEQLGVKSESISEKYLSDEMFAEGLTLNLGKTELARLGQVSKKMLHRADVAQSVFYGEVAWESILNFTKNAKIVFKPLSKYPAVRRDFALLLDEAVSFTDIKKVIKQTERKLLKSVSLFDVYEGDNLPEGKKSYAISVVLQDEEKTLTDNQIEAVSQKLQKAFEKQLGASLR